MGSRLDFPTTLLAMQQMFPSEGTAAAYLRRTAPEIRGLIADWTGEHAYAVDLVLKDMIKRCRERKLLMTRPHEELRIEVAIMLTMQTMNFVHGTRHLVTV